MIEKILKIISVIVIAVAIGVYTYIVPLAKEDIKEVISTSKVSTFSYDKYQIITNPRPSDIVYMTTMLAGTLIVTTATTFVIKEYV